MVMVRGEVGEHTSQNVEGYIPCGYAAASRNGETDFWEYGVRADQQTLSPSKEDGIEDWIHYLRAVSEKLTRNYSRQSHQIQSAINGL